MKNILLFLSFLLSGCGHWPPVIENQRDIVRLSSSEQSACVVSLHDNDIPSLAHLRALRLLQFRFDPFLTDHGLLLVSRLDLPDLDTLELSYCNNITDAGLAPLTQLQKIHTLLLIKDPAITDAGLQSIIKMPHLTYLSLAACPGITDAGISSLLAAPALADIDIRSCPALTEHTLQTLSHMRSLHSITLGGSPHITQAAISRFHATSPDINLNTLGPYRF